jgi:hypothetical protein
VPKIVVERLEAVQVDHEDGDRIAVVFATSVAFYDPVQAVTVEQAGEFVVVGRVFELALQVLSVRDVLDLGDEVERRAFLGLHQRDTEQPLDDVPRLVDVELYKGVRLRSHPPASV